MTAKRLIVFARYPSPGRAKTRLIPALGTHGASLLQHRMTLATLQTAARFTAADGARVQLRVSGDPAATRELYPGEWEVIAQGSGSLGERLTRAAAAAFADGAGRVVVIGSDCPALTAEHLSAAFTALDGHDIVVGPAADGGYYLIGLRHSAPRLFDAIAWGSDRVLAQTRAAAAQEGLSIAFLDTLLDVDRPEDLSRIPAAYRPQRFGVTGATSALGTRFLRRMLGAVSDLHVTALVRRNSPSFQRAAFQSLLAEHGVRIRLLDGDVRSLNLSASQRQALIETDGGLWHFAANTNLRPGSGDFAGEVWGVNDGGTAALLDLLRASDRPGPLFHISTAYVCGAGVGVALEEGDRPLGVARNSYEASKRSAEHRVRLAMDKGLRGAIFRPSVIVGDERTGGACNAVDLFGEAMIHALANDARPLVLQLSADAEINVVHADWVVEAMATLAGHGAAGRTYHLTSRAPLRLAELAFETGRPSPLLFAQPGARMEELPPIYRAVNRTLATLRPYLMDKVRFDRRNLDCDAPELRAVLEFDPVAVFNYRMAKATGNLNGSALGA